MTDWFVTIVLELGLLGLVVVSSYKSRRSRRPRSGVSAELQTLRGPGSRRRFGIAYGFGSVLLLQVINVSEAFKGNKVFLSVFDLGVLFYLCFYSGWFRNKIIEQMTRWEARPE